MRFYPRRYSRKSNFNSTLDLEMPALAKLWTLRLLVPLYCKEPFFEAIKEKDAKAISIAEAIEFSSWQNSEKASHDLIQLYHKAEKEFNRKNDDPVLFDMKSSEHPLRKNIARLAKLSHLSQTDCEVLEFFIFLHTSSALQYIFDLLHLTGSELAFILGKVLDIKESDVRTSLRKKGALLRSGLLEVDCSPGSAIHDLAHNITFISTHFANEILTPDVEIANLFHNVKVSPAPELSLDDYPHLKYETEILLSYLQETIFTKRKGSNVLLHGKSGTGKTQFARALAKALNYKMLEVATDDEEEDFFESSERIRNYNVIQHFFSHSSTLVLFDEVEEILAGSRSMGLFFNVSSKPSPNKAALNNLLEENAIPTIWIANEIDAFDKAFIRRFDVCLEVPVPPRSQRYHILEQKAGSKIEASMLAKLANAEHLSPAIVTRALSVADRVAETLEKQKVAETLINATLSAQNQRPIKRHDPTQLPEVYDPRFVNADTDLVALCKGLCSSKAGRLCFYGAPGTGKTAFGRYMAEQMDLPLIIKKPSDLMGMWVGQNEKNIARAFAQAEKEGAVLLMDEVDSFLQDRSTAVINWEMTLVNEMLIQMESFSGVFIASTNLMDGLDKAALRRFDMKIKFDYLLSKQAWLLFKQHCAQLELDAAEHLHKRLNELTQLAPGDFATVVRRNKFHPLKTAESFLIALENECSIKEGSKNKIGFATA